MKNNRYYSQVNFTPLLDVIFITLFVLILGASVDYRTDVDSKRETIDSLQSETESLSYKMELLLQQNSILSDTLSSERMELADLQQALELQVQQNSAMSITVSTQEEEIDNLRRRLDQLQQENSEALSANEDYQDQIELLAEVVGDQKSVRIIELVKAFETIYSINVSAPDGQGVYELQVMKNDGLLGKEQIGSQEQVNDFLDEYFLGLDPNTYIILVFASDAKAIHKKWIENYFDDNQFTRVRDWRMN